MKISSKYAASWLSVAVAVVATAAAAGCSSSTSTAASGKSASPSGGASSSSAGAASGLTVKQLAFGTTLKHSFQPGGKGASKTESLSQPDDLVALGGNIYVGFQNNVGSQGETAPSGNNDSTLVEFTKTGSKVAQWDVTGKIDGLGADTSTGQVIVTVNEDANSSLYTVTPGSATATHYTYSPALPHKGGTDNVAVLGGKLLISASAPGTSGKAPASAPAVLAVTLNPAKKIAADAPFFADNATATAVNGSGKSTALSLSDPDSSAVAPSSSPQFGGDYMLDAQGDLQLIFSDATGKKLQALKISQSVDDSAWATSATGTLFITDSGANSLDAVTGSLTPGTLYTSVTPCNANNAPSTCPGPGFPDNYLGTINLKSGAVTKAAGLSGPLTPKGMIFVP